MSLRSSQIANQIPFSALGALTSPGNVEDYSDTTIHVLSANPGGNSFTLAIDLSPEDGVSGDNWGQVGTIECPATDGALTIVNCPYKAYRLRLRQLGAAAGVVISAWMFN